METSTGHKIKVGVFTIVGILLFIVGIFIIGSKKNMFSDTFSIHGNFKNVGGLAVGNNIRFAGIIVGTVEKISIVSDTVVRVDMRMKEEVQKFLKADVRATIGSDGLMGDKLVTIIPGSASEKKSLSNGSQIKTEDPIDFDKIMGKFTTVASNAEVITSELAGMAVQISKGDGTLGRLLYSNQLSKSLEGTAANAERLTNSLAGITTHIKSGKGSIGSLVYTDTVSNHVEAVVGNANNAMLTINEAAYGFSENMKALHENFLFRSYFKRKEKEAQKGGENNNAQQIKFDVDSTAPGMDTTELVEIIAEAQKALDAKRRKGS
jgi:phospholipid/cholesterol/gamma-HCH transport system substrate-binding protein